ARALAHQGQTDKALQIALELVEGAPGQEADNGYPVVLEFAITALDLARERGPVADELKPRLRAAAVRLVAVGEALIAAGKPKQAAQPLVSAGRLGADASRVRDLLRKVVVSDAFRESMRTDRSLLNVLWYFVRYDLGGLEGLDPWS